MQAIFERRAHLPWRAVPGKKRLRHWIAQVEAMPFKALKSFVATLRNWWEQILNYFDGRFNNGFAEGVNLEIKMLNRRGYLWLSKFQFLSFARFGRF